MLTAENLQTNSNLAFSRTRSRAEMSFDSNGVFTLPQERASLARFITQTTFVEYNFVLSYAIEQ